MPELLLVEMPFKTVDRPSIGLSLLRASALRAGYSCEVRYANLPFAEQIGFDLYRTIAADLLPESLFGDRVFAPQVVGDRRPDADESLAGVPARLRALLPALQREACRFVDQLADELLGTGHRWFGLSAMFQVMPSLALSRALKQREPGCKVIIGGACCEGEMGLALHEEYPWLDFVCRGEGESFVVKLLDHLTTGRPALEEIPGLVARDGASSVIADKASAIDRDLDALPIPQYHDWLRQVEPYAGELPLSHRWLPVETSRGCWWGQKSHCIFCGLNGTSLAFREKSPGRAWDEIAACVATGIPRIYFVDLILPHRYFDTLLPRLASTRPDLTMFFEVKSNLTRRQLELLAAAGVRLLQPGIESFSTPVLRLMRKGVNGLQNLRLLKWAAEFGMDVSWNLLFGFPGEDPEEYASMARLVPSIEHLQPPHGGCRRVRIDRFSPLFFDKETFGLRSLRPAPAYEAVHDAPPDRLSRLAYYFEADPAELPDTDSPGYGALESAVSDWTRHAGEVSFTSVTLDGRVFLFDRRSDTTERSVILEGVEKDVYDACDAGATKPTLARSLDVPADTLDRVLTSLQRRRLVTTIDDHYLALSVRMDRWIPQGTPESVLGPVCHALHCARMIRLKDSAAWSDTPATAPPTPPGTRRRTSS